MEKVFVKNYMGVNIYLNKEDGKFYADFANDPNYNRAIHWDSTLSGAEAIILRYLEQPVYILFKGTIAEVSMRIDHGNGTIDCKGAPNGHSGYWDIKAEYVPKTDAKEAIVKAAKASIKEFTKATMENCWNRIKGV